MNNQQTSPVFGVQQTTYCDLCVKRLSDFWIARLTSPLCECSAALPNQSSTTRRPSGVYRQASCLSSGFSPTILRAETPLPSRVHCSSLTPVVASRLNNLRRFHFLGFASEANACRRLATGGLRTILSGSSSLPRRRRPCQSMCPKVAKQRQALRSPSLRRIHCSLAALSDCFPGIHWYGILFSDADFRRIRGRRNGLEHHGCEWGDSDHDARWFSMGRVIF
jgi:hypothetical protein